MITVLMSVLALSGIDHHAAPTAAEVMAAADADGNNSLSYEEYAAYRADKASKEEFAMIAGEDKMISLEEVDAAIKAATAAAAAKSAE